ncbi:hypothetical protein ASE38_13920 [Cellulomonas sp. Root930]|nr:hypothetical protein ASE38_13920 [Cellulomonas sp. Root930]
MPDRRTAVDRVPFLRARRVARAASVGFLLLAGFLARSIAVLTGLEGVSPVAILPFLALCVVCVVAWFVLGRLWRRVGDLRPATLPVDAGDGALQGAPERDGPEGGHLSLRGEVDPPRRW